MPHDESGQHESSQSGQHEHSHMDGKEKSRLILGLSKLAVKVLVPLLAAGGVGTGTYAALRQRDDKQQVSTSYEQIAARFNSTLDQLDQMRLRQAEHNEDMLRLRLALHEIDDRLRTVERRTRPMVAVAKPPKPPKGGVVSPPPPPPAPASQPKTSLEDLLTKRHYPPLPAFKAQKAPVRFDLAAQKK